MDKLTNWEAIKAEWCSGASARVLAKEYGISHTAINGRAKSEQWERVSTQVSTLKKVSTSSGGGNPAKTSKGGASRKVSTLQKAEKTPKTKRNSRGGNLHPGNLFTDGNRAALRHGGYSRRLLYSEAILEDAAALTLEDELLRVRAANLEASENVGRWKAQLDDAGDEARKQLMQNIAAAEKSMDRNTARIESLVVTLTMAGRTVADTELKNASREKALFELEQARMTASLERERKKLVNKKIQAEIDRGDPASDDNVIVVHNALAIPGAVQPVDDNLPN
ncbi:hypothetical protein [Enterobacter kobei]|uniref:hypothetical protein n=1 Tax=Enterobacter kobei TaxID=208224 RepID=UPI00092CEB52|nr:hypothetical protein [Enterobacter kobei]